MFDFTNRFTRSLPADPEVGPARRAVRGAAFSRVEPTAVAAPELVAASPEMMQLLGIDAAELDDLVDVLAGNRLPEGADPFAMAYAGHQFGNWAGQLGDGRAIALGEVRATDGSHQTLQLKGAGPTPYSRGADGRAVLRSSVREFLCSEAMHHLGIPTTRALSLVLTGEKVVRDMFYDGHPEAEPGAVVCRVAPSFTRFGNFQLPASHADLDLLGQLVTFTIVHDFDRDPEDIVGWFADVVARTAHLVAEWMRVGFVHGVMNTDNMSILGLTIDYGPYGWVDNFDLDWTPNTTDNRDRRYRFGQQAPVAHWNLAQFGSAIAGLIPDQIDELQTALESFRSIYQSRMAEIMAAKLGLVAYDDDLVDELHAVLALVETDMTIFFRTLSQLTPELDAAARRRLMAEAHYHEPTEEQWARIDAWLVDYLARPAVADRATAMNRVNPKYVLRNYLAQLAIDEAESGDYSMIHELLDCLRHPYDEQPDRVAWAAKRPDWARSRAGCSQLSCSS